MNDAKSAARTGDATMLTPVGRDHGSYVELYVHLVWATRERAPFLVEPVRARVYACILAECRDLHVEVVALNGTEDHVHLFVRIPSSANVGVIAKQAKGASSHLMTHELGHDGFRWQEGYAALSVSRWDVSKIVGYIDRQEEHHREGTHRSILEPPSH